MPKFVLTIEYDEEDAQAYNPDVEDWTAEAAYILEDAVGLRFGMYSKVTTEWED